MRAVEELAVEGRILAHQHGVEVAQRGLTALAAGLLGAEPLRLFAGEGDVTHGTGHQTGRPGRMGAPVQVLRLAHADAVSACLRLAHHGKGGVLVDDEGLDGVGNEEQVHAGSLRAVGPYTRRRGA